MVILKSILLWFLVQGVHLGVANATDQTKSPATTTSTNTSTDAVIYVTSGSEAAVPTGTYIVYTTDSIVSFANTTTAINATATGNATTTTSGTNIVVVGTGVSNSTSTRSSTNPANTQACNGYTEFCERKYSNITMVTAHNSPFVKKNNIASNQDYKVTTQLDDGVRMLSFEAHYYEDDIYLCHSSCELLNMGTLKDYLSTVTTWVKQNPYEVVTILIVNSDYVAPANFSAPIQDSGLIDYVYEPWKVPMSLNDWPTLSEMIISDKRAVVFMDYQANQTAFPYIMDEFSQMWETPFSPLNRSFPCTVQRPPGIDAAQAEDRMYMINHNLNLEVILNGNDILIPDSAQLNQTNAVSGYGSLGLMANNCRSKWDRPPNFLLVDYYNDGNFAGSVFEVAAEMNNVTYNRKCCGEESGATSMIYTGSQLYRWTSILGLLSLYML